MRFDGKKLLLYAVTDRGWVRGKTLEEQVEEALAGGVTCLQLREKTMEESAFEAEAITVKRLCHAHGVPLIINDSLSVAMKAGADGIHVGQDDISPEQVRKIAGKDFIVGVTAKTVEQARRAESAGADYLGVGAVFPSPTKKNAIRITTEQLHEICTAVSVPAVAIGGITHENIGLLRGGGMCGVAVVSALFAADDIGAAAVRLKKRAAEIVGK